MTRSRAAALALLLALPHLARAEEESASTAMLVYSDDDGVLVLVPSLGGRVTIDGALVLSGRAQVDVVSAASVDLVSAASPNGYREVRAGAGGGAELRLGPGHSVGLDYALSHEPDFVQHALRASHAIDLFDRRSTLSASYGLSLTSVGRAGDVSFSNDRRTHELAVSWTEVLNRSLQLDLFASAASVDGFQSSPYRLVPLHAPGASTPATQVVERVPALRVLTALGARARGRLAEGWFGAADVRLYLDSWGVVAPSAGGRLSHELVEGALTLTGELRVYGQTKASFYRTRYETFPAAPSLRTADKELGTMWTVLAGADLEWTVAVGPEADLRIGVGGDVYHLGYPDHPRLAARTAVLGLFELTVER